ncbi:MAG TPA: PRC-barrel domain-containing protein, partial [Actinomycetota bacterium]|nr:PRC-barrel domain-containing protein [Actinomycetota bacterium]
MPALDPETRERWRDLVVVDRDAATVGTITAFYLDRATGLPTWALVHTGWFTDAQTFVPLTHAVETNEEIRVPYPKAFVQQAPRIQAHQELSPDHEVVLSAYYGLDDHRGAVADRRLGEQPAVPG